MSGHTPGEWSICDGPQNYQHRIYDADDGRTICEVVASTDALVIAAAPLMLKTLRRAVLALAFAAETSPAMHDDYLAVSAAIAKATGPQP